jgi:ferredoxin-thioredoxin reductase catalytic chain
MRVRLRRDGDQGEDQVSDSIGKGEVTRDEVERLFTRLDQEAESAGYHLNPNREFTLGLIEGMLVNERRYGYWACPCRLASGVKKEDLDIICPCDYRDPDVAEYGTCYCGLYVSQDVVDGKRKVTRIPERRPPEGMGAGGTTAPADRMAETPASGVPSSASPASPGGLAGLPSLAGLKYPLWRCRVCGYLCARGQPPEVCPICRAKKDRFERLL